MPMYRGGGLSPWKLVLVALPLFVAGVAVPAAMLPSALADERAYTEAEPCPKRAVGAGAVGAGTVGADCLLTRQASVAAKDVTGSGDNKKYFLVIGFPDGTQERVKLRKNNHGKVETGEPVTAVSWRDEIREITTRDDERLATWTYPVGSYIPLLIVAVIGTPSGASILWTAYWSRRLRRAGRSLVSTGRWRTSVPLATAALYGVAATIAIAVTPSFMAAVGAASVVAVAAVPLAALVWHRQRKNTGAKAADLLAATGVSVPTAETVIPARVSGEVPYSRVDCDYLVLAPGGLAVTPDARGMSWRLPLPWSLTFVRLHRAESVGRARVPGVGSPLLVECRDGDREVLITANRNHVPWILGALRPQPQGSAR
ncbi:hypothetical protein [Streptomyces sp. TRM68416]|uniref:hypothetical protein n=1 Tax=Streptomyces sp. TRM68416 TaxID=2758412 RepID=UPI001661F74C|nr:hypothetical protein [Streptomyces sp. TRM68416]MBD0843917.1 hypothetical protein [Streptomyces sp. TRM68416]